MNSENLHEQQKHARQEKVGLGFDFEADIIRYIDEQYPPGKELTKVLNQSYKQALADKDGKKLNELAHRLDVKINYLSPKYQDSDAEKEYITKLELLHEELLNKIEFKANL